MWDHKTHSERSEQDTGRQLASRYLDVPEFLTVVV